jgi:hypothetical protein
MRVDGAQEHHVQRVRQLYVVYIVRETFDEPRIFRPLDSLTNVFASHVSSLGIRLSDSADFRLSFARSVLNGFDDVLIPGAAAEIAFQTVTYLGLAGIGIAIEDLCGSHDHSRSAIAALQSMVFPKSFLHRVELAVPRKSLDGGYIRAVSLDGEHRAGLHSLTIHQHGTGTAQRCLAPDVGSSQVRSVTQVVNQQYAWLNLILALDAINPQFDFGLHAHLMMYAVAVLQIYLRFSRALTRPGRLQQRAVDPGHKILLFFQRTTYAEDRTRKHYGRGAAAAVFYARPFPL